LIAGRLFGLELGDSSEAVHHVGAFLQRALGGMGQPCR
jgi:hypothetical protein